MTIYNAYYISLAVYKQLAPASKVMKLILQKQLTMSSKAMMLMLQAATITLQQQTVA